MKAKEDTSKTQQALQRCTNPKCAELFEPHTLAGRTKKYCSKKCKWEHWNDENPRVKKVKEGK